MSILNKYSGLVIAVLAVAVIVLAAVLIAQNMGGPAPAGNTQNAGAPTGAPPSNNGTASNPSATNTGTRTNPSIGTKTTPPLTGFTIKVLTPTAGAAWTIGQQNTISWNPEAGTTGVIELLQAGATKNFVGIILPQTGPHQTSYTWSTRDLSLSRTNPAGITVAPGSYVIRILFDGNNLAAATSPAFTIVQ